MATLASLLGATLSPRLGALYMVVMLYFAIFVAIPAAVQTNQGRFPFGSSYSDQELAAGFMLVALGQLCLVVGVGCAVTTRERPDPLEAAPAQYVSRDEPRAALRLGLVFAALSVVIAVVAGPSRVFAPRFSDIAEAAAGEGIAIQLVYVARAFALVALLLSVLSRKRATDRLVKRRAGQAVLFTSLVALTVNYPPALPRFQLLGVVFAVLVILVDFTRPRAKVLFGAGATMFLLYVFSAIKDLSNGLSVSDIAKQSPSDYLLTADLDSFKQIVDTAIYFSSAPLRHGENFLGAILFWVPRSLWPGKPVHTGEIVSGGLGYPYTNVSNPLPAEGYASWGTVGTIVVMFAVGLAIGRLETRARRLRIQPPIPSSLDYALAAGYATILLRGALNSVAPMIFTAFLLAAIVHLVFRHGRSATPRSSVRRRNNAPKIANTSSSSRSRRDATREASSAGA